MQPIFLFFGVKILNLPCFIVFFVKFFLVWKFLFSFEQNIKMFPKNCGKRLATSSSSIVFFTELNQLCLNFQLRSPLKIRR